MPSVSDQRERISPTNAALLSLEIFAFAMAVCLPSRHFFDDETINVFLLREKSIGQLYRFAQGQDVHPPLSYIFNGIVYKATGNPNSILWVNAALMGIALFVFVRAVGERVQSDLLRVVLAAGTALNPSLLLWGVSLRWYSYWIPLAMAIFVIVFLAPRKRSSLPLAAGLCVLSFYIGYLTLVYITVVVGVEWMTRGVRLTRRLICTTCWSLAAILPQCYYLVKVHIPQGKGQSSHELIKVVGSAGIGTFVGPLVFPVSPWAIAFTLATLAVISVILVRNFQFESGSLLARLRSIDPLLLAALGLCVLETVLGIAIKERNLAIASILLFSWLPTRMHLAPKIFSYSYLTVWALFLSKCTWNMALQHDTGKASVNTPVADLRRQILADEARFETDDTHTYLVTWDKDASCYGLLWNMRTLSPLVNGVEHEADTYDFHIPVNSLVVVLQTQGPRVNSGYGTSHYVADKASANLTRTSRASLGFDRYHTFETKMTGAYFPPYQIDYLAGFSKRALDLHWVGASNSGSWQKDQS